MNEGYEYIVVYKMKNVKSLVFGMITAVLAWVTLMVADIIDEFVIDTDSLLGGIVFFTIPIAMLVIYIIHNRKNNPSWKKLLLWFAGYLIAFLPIWGYMYESNNRREFFIEQHARSGFLDLNGLEYMFYGFSALIAFMVLCLGFHIIRIIIRLIRKK